MNFFKNIFSSNSELKEPKNQIPWKSLSTVEQLDEIITTSKTKTVLIFKHSTRCGISRMVLSRFEESFNDNKDAVEFYYLDLLNFRSISDEVAARFQVFHQSPQLLVIKNGACVAQGSHYSILEMEIN